MERIHSVSLLDTRNFNTFVLTKYFCIFSDDDTWEPVTNLDCPEIIEGYEDVKRKKKELKKARKSEDSRVKNETKSENPPKKKKKVDTFTL